MSKLREVKTEVDFKNSTIGEAFEFVSLLSPVPFVVDWDSLEAIGIERHKPFRFHAAEISLPDLVDVILRQAAGREAELGYEWVSGVVVSSRDKLPYRSTGIPTTPYNDKTEAAKAKYHITPTPDEKAPDGVFIPRDLEACFLEMRQMLTAELVREFQALPEGDAVAHHHFGLGMWMRNRWGLWNDSPLAKYFNALGIEHPDDMSGIILTSFHRQLHGRNIAIDEQVRFCQEYWRRQSDKTAASRPASAASQ